MPVPRRALLFLVASFVVLVCPGAGLAKKHGKSAAARSYAGQELKLLCTASGVYEMFISSGALKIVSKSIGISLRSVAPDWDVVLSRDDVRQFQRLPYARAMKMDLSPFYLYSVRKELVKPSGTGDARVQNRICKLYVFKGDYDSSFAWKGSFLGTGTRSNEMDLIALAQAGLDKPGAIVYRLFGIPRQSGCPIILMSKRTDGSQGFMLKLLSVKDATMPASAFVIPSGYKEVGPDKKSIFFNVEQKKDLELFSTPQKGSL